MKITANDLADDRFSRLRLIQWWDQVALSRTKVLVVGAGALGNEILKNLALLGFQNIVVIDCDRVEESNLSRSILFRPDQVGSPKAMAAADAVTGIYGDSRVVGLVADIMHGVGLGLFYWADVVIAGLDNREARLCINRSCWKLNKPWVDGAIEGVNGVARVFIPGCPPCYECTLGEADWQLISHRLSCNLLAHASDTAGKTPTTPTISSIIGGIQVQEAVKLIHGLPTLSGKGFHFEGINHTSYVVSYTENPDCYSHYRFQEIVPLASRSDETTLVDLHIRAQKDLSASDVTLDFSREVIHALHCSHCGYRKEIFAPVGTVRTDEAVCPNDGQEMPVLAIHGYSGDESYGSRKLSELGLPLLDVFSARAGTREIHYLMWSDRHSVLGKLADEDLVDECSNACG